MRRLILSIGACACLFSATWALAGGGAAIQIPAGQTFEKFNLPIYENGQLKESLSAESATGKTDTRAETTDLKIEVYDAGALSLTITSPKADLYLNYSDDAKERKMRTKDTVRVERSDMIATAQTGDFDQLTGIYIMRTNVKVILKNFDIGKSVTPDAPPASSPSDAAPAASTPPGTPPAASDSSLNSPGTNSGTNSAPPLPTTPPQ